MFAHTNLPPTTHLQMLAVRSRLAKITMGVKTKDVVVERRVIRPRVNWRDRYLQSVINLTQLQNSGYYYVSENKRVGTIDNKPVDHRAKAILGTLRPRNVRMANSKMIEWCAENLYQYADSEEQRYNMTKLDIKYFSLLHKYKDKGPKLVTVDIEDEEHLKPIRDELSGFEVWMLTKTARGYHLILDLSDEKAASDFYNKGKKHEAKKGVWPRLVEKYGNKVVEIQRDSQEPIPGTEYTNPNKPDEVNFVRILQ